MQNNSVVSKTVIKPTPEKLTRTQKRIRRILASKKNQASQSKAAQVSESRSRKLADLPQAPRYAGKDPKFIIDTLLARSNHTLAMSIVSQRQHREIVAEAYSAYAAWQGLANKDGADELGRLHNQRRGAKTRVNKLDPIRLILSTLIDYQDRSQTLSRDCRAIRYAESETITPERFLRELTKPKTGGLEKWAKLSPRTTNRGKAANVVPPKKVRLPDDRPPKSPQSNEISISEEAARTLKAPGYHLLLVRVFKGRKPPFVSYASRTGYDAPATSKQMKKMMAAIDDATRPLLAQSAQDRRRA